MESFSVSREVSKVVDASCSSKEEFQACGENIGSSMFKRVDKERYGKVPKGERQQYRQKAEIWARSRECERL